MFQVLRLKDHILSVSHLDDLSAHEAELLVVVEHCVHVLDPDGVDRSVKDYPLPTDSQVFGLKIGLN